MTQYTLIFVSYRGRKRPDAAGPVGKEADPLRKNPTTESLGEAKPKCDTGEVPLWVPSRGSFGRPRLSPSV